MIEMHSSNLSAEMPPSVAEHLTTLYAGQSYTHHSEIPAAVQRAPGDGEDVFENASLGTPCVLGVDEAGRGPVIGPMVYGILYLPIQLQHHLLADTHHFDDSKVLTPAVRADLMQKICTPGSDLYESCGWAVRSLSARDIGAGMLKNGGPYNLNAQAMDATVELIRGVIDRGVNVQEIYVDTIGVPMVYQKKLERIFPTIKITVEKKADSLFPCVSAASVVAKVTRDVSCEELYEQYLRGQQSTGDTVAVDGWGSGYPSDARCITWLKSSVDPVFGWGGECRFSWGTVKDMLELKQSESIKSVQWPDDGDENNMKVSHFFAAGSAQETEQDELRDWFGTNVKQDVF